MRRADGVHASPLLPGRGYSLKIGAQTVTATITQLKYKTNVNTLERMAGATLGPVAVVAPRPASTTSRMDTEAAIFAARRSGVD